MKNSLILLLFGVLAFAVFTGIGTAEEVGKGKKVLKSFDVSILFIQDVVLESVIGTGRRLKQEMDSAEILPEEVKESVLNAIDFEDSEAWFSPNGMLWVKGTQEEIAKAGALIAKMLPKKFYYDFRLVLLKKERAKDFETPPGAKDVDLIVAGLLKEGYEPLFDVRTSLITGKWSFISETFQTAYIAEYEGLIATASSFLDPVVEVVTSGMDIKLRAAEKRGRFCLEMALSLGVLKGIDTIKTDGYPVDNPRISLKKWDCDLDFTGKSLRWTGFRCGGYEHLLLVKAR